MRSATAALCAFALFHCGSGSAARSVSAEVGPEGGTISFPSGPTLTVPRSALASHTQITIQAVAGAPSDALSSLYKFGPEGTTFAVPATVSFPVPAGATDVAVYWTKRGSAANFEAIDAPISQGSAWADIGHFSSGYLGVAHRPARTVSGKLSTIFWADDGTKSVRDGAFAPSVNISALYVPTSSGYTRMPVTPAADTSFSVPNVPSGRYFLEADMTYDSQGQPFTQKQLIEMTSSTPDLSSVSAARADIAVETKPTSITLDLQNLVPWTLPSGDFTGDMLLLSGAQANVYSRPIIQARPAAGATTWHVQYDWRRVSTAAAIGLPDASRGDVEYVYQRATVPVGSGSTQGVSHSAARYAKLMDLTVKDGVAASIAATLQDAPQTGHLRVDLHNADYAALAPQVSPYATPLPGAGVSILAIPRSLEFPDSPGGQSTSSLLYVQGPSNANVDYGIVAYGQFFGPAWQEARYVLYQFDAEIPLAGTKATFSAFAQLLSLERAETAGPIAPAVGPPRSPRINGFDAFSQQSGVGTEPTLSWSPPSLGAATSYNVNIYSASAPAVSILIYSGTSLQIPPGFLSPGTQYVATITANSAPWDELDRAPFRTGLPMHSADCVTSVFTP